MKKNKIFDKAQSILIVNDFHKDYLQNIVRLEKECFPATWQYSTAEEYYTAMLNDKTNLNVFLLSNDEVIGYVLVKPLKTAALELQKADPQIQADKKKYYIETIQILPECQEKGGARKLLTAVCQEALKRGISKFAIHARMSNKFNEKLKAIFSDSIIYYRNIEKWQWGDGEPYQYIEWEYNES
jgi:ribosomal protein S18 acetylase RimI-like enzyme